MFLRRAQCQRQRVQSALELRRERLMRRPRPRHAGLAPECLGHHEDGKMRLTLRAGAGMTGMAGAVVLDTDDTWRERPRQGGFDALGAGGDVALCVRGDIGLHHPHIGQPGSRAKPCCQQSGRMAITPE